MYRVIQKLRSVATAEIELMWRAQTALQEAQRSKKVIAKTRTITENTFTYHKYPLQTYSLPWKKTTGPNRKQLEKLNIEKSILNSDFDDDIYDNKKNNNFLS